MGTDHRDVRVVEGEYVATVDRKRVAGLIGR